MKKGNIVYIKTWLLACLFLTSCCVGKNLFDGKYVPAHIATEANFGQYGLMEISIDEYHEQASLALYDKDDLDSTAMIDSKYYVKVKSYKDIPQVVDIQDTSARNLPLYRGVPITTLDYHILSNHGAKAGWHYKGHRINNGFNLSDSTFKMLKLNTLVDTITGNVPANLIPNAILIESLTTLDTIYYNIDTTTMIFIELDTVHRHGNRKFKN